MRGWLPMALVLVVGTAGCGKDEDGDGYKANEDCDDLDPNAYPTATEVCDGIDNDCDGVVDPATATDATTWYADADGDGDGDGASTEVACQQPDGFVATGTDCDDDDATTWAGAPEVCTDGYDNQCEEDNAFDCDDTDCTGDGACTPALTGIAPDRTGLDQSVAVTLTGAGFAWLTAGTTEVAFGSVGACTGVSVVDDGTITCDAPASSVAGSVDVTVTNANGAASLTQAFTYEDVLFAADGKAATPGSLYRIDPSDASSVVVGALTDSSGTAWSFTALAFAPDGTLYGLTSTEGTTTSQLCTIDTDTAQVTVVAGVVRGDGTTESSLPDATFAGSRLLAWTESGDDPVEIDTTTGTSTVLGPGVSSAGSGLATNADGDVYSVPRGSTIYTVDPGTGTVTATSATATNTNGTFNSMTFHRGTLYAVDSEDAGDATSPAALATIDPATGATTTIGPLPTGIDAIASYSP